MVEQESVAQLVSNAYESLRGLDLPGAVGLLERALAVDFEEPEVLWSLKCANFWTGGLARLDTMSNPFERGEYLVAQWKAFTGFVSKLGQPYERGYYAFKRYAFSQALAQYRALSAEERDAHSAEFALCVGRCHKGSGDYDEALRALEAAARERRDDAEILAELADNYGLRGELRSSKALFREAFYLGAQRIQLDLLESEMIRRLVERVASLGYAGAELAEWIPVYGQLYGVFSVKRELKTVEAGKLRQSIYQLENDRESGENKNLASPRLINRYFWLIDHYIAVKENRAKIDELLLKIRLIDPSIHKQYTA